MTDTREHSTAFRSDRSGQSVDAFLSIASFYLAFAIAYRPADFTVLRWPASLLLGCLLGVLGWRSFVAVPSLKRYMMWAVLFITWLAISSVAAWTSLSLYRARYYGLWVLLTVPGVALLTRAPRYRRAFTGGIVSGASIYPIVALFRMLDGRSIFDGETYPLSSYILGLNRNIAAATSLIALPLIFSNDVPPALRRLRWPLATVAAFWIMYSRSRLVLLAAAVGGLVWIVIQRDLAGKGRKLLTVVLASLVMLLVIHEVGGDARIGFDRVTEGFSDDGGSNEVRRLLVRKAWHLTEEQPVFGIGLGRFPGAYHPVLEKASSVKVRRQATNSYDHNGYAGMMAEAGFPALLLMLGLLGSLVAAGLRNRASLAVRLAVCAFSVTIVYLTAASLPRIAFVAMVLLLGAAIREEARERIAASPTDLSTARA